jgi:hypothetical protein
MDPFTITTTVVSGRVRGISTNVADEISQLNITATCLTTAKDLHALRKKYNDAPMTVLSMCSETTLVTAALSQIQNLVLRKEDMTSLLRARSDLAAALDTALIGCAVLFSCLDEEIQRINRTALSAGQFSWRGKLRVIWNHDRLKELLDGLRGQLTAINAVVNLLSLDTLAEVKQMLHSYTAVFTQSVQRAKSFRQSAASHNIPESIYDGGGQRNSILDVEVDVFSIAASEQEFDFDDLIVDSKIYRRVLAQAKHRAHENRQPVVEGDIGDLIDLTDAETLRNVTIQDDLDSAVKLLDGMVITDDFNFNFNFDALDSDGIEEEGGFPAAPRIKSIELSDTGLTHDSNFASTRTQQEYENSYTDTPDVPPARPTTVRAPVTGSPSFKTPAAAPAKTMVASPMRQCFKCREQIVGQFVREFGEMFHISCFTCMVINLVHLSRYIY